MSDTSIEWADKVWNPVTGCTKVSDGCRNCYAERMSKRLAGRAGYPEDGFKVTLHPDKLDEPLRWKKPARVFVCSMGDLFHEDVPDEFVAKVFGVMRNKKYTFMILTKRPERMLKFLKRAKKWEGWVTHDGTPVAKAYDGTGIIVGDAGNWPPSNLWLGVSVEDQKTADERIPLLLQTPAAKRFVSYEPALGPVDFEKWLVNLTCEACGRWTCIGSLPHRIVNAPRLDWVIMGGESGPGARPLHPDWARSVRDQCQTAGVPFFFKQNGEWVECTAEEYLNANPGLNNRRVFPDGVEVIRVGKKAAGCLLDGKEHKERP